MCLTRSALARRISNRCKCWFYTSPATLPRPIAFLDPSFEPPTKTDIVRAYDRHKDDQRLQRRPFADAVQALRDERSHFHIVSVMYGRPSRNRIIAPKAESRDLDCDVARTPHVENCNVDEPAESALRPKEESLCSASYLAATETLRSDSDVADAALTVIAEEIGVDRTTAFRHIRNLPGLGMDSSCMLRIVARLRDEVGLLITQEDVCKGPEASLGTMILIAARDAWIDSPDLMAGSARLQWL